MGQIAKTISLAAVLLGLLVAIVFLSRPGIDPEQRPDPTLIATLSAAFGAGVTAAIKYFTDRGDGAAGPGAVLLVAAATAIGGQSCRPAETPRETARSVVLSVAEGVRVGDEACASIAIAKSDLELAESCATFVREAREQLITAEEMIDAWQAGETGRIACAVRDASSALGRLLDTVRRAGGKPPPAVEDALRLAPQLAGACRGR